MLKAISWPIVIWPSMTARAPNSSRKAVESFDTYWMAFWPIEASIAASNELLT